MYIKTTKGYEKSYVKIAYRLKQIINDYKSEGVKKGFIAEKWGFSCTSNLDTWIKSVENGTACLNKLFEILAVEKTTLQILLKGENK